MKLVKFEDIKDSIEDPTAGIKNRRNLADFVASLREDFEADPDSWENPTLDMCLESLEAVIRDTDGGKLASDQKGHEQPTWAFIGELLLGPKYYE